MIKVLDYTYVSTSDESKIKTLVNENIKNGWQPLGGIAVANNGSKIIFIQAMVTYLDNVVD